MQTEKHVVIFPLFPNDVHTYFNNVNTGKKELANKDERNAEMVEMKFELNIRIVRKK